MKVIARKDSIRLEAENLLDLDLFEVWAETQPQAELVGAGERRFYTPEGVFERKGLQIIFEERE